MKELSSGQAPKRDDESRYYSYVVLPEGERGKILYMANPAHAYTENVTGNFFVDDTCIDCDLCRQIAPSVFKEYFDHSAVFHQPESETETHRAAMALVACPTASIGTRDKLD